MDTETHKCTACCPTCYACIFDMVDQQKEWVGLTDDQMRAIAEWQISAHRPLIDVIKAVEQALKEKNT